MSGLNSGAIMGCPAILKEEIEPATDNISADQCRGKSLSGTA